MIRRVTLASAAALTLALMLALPAAAGGWASVSLQEGAPTEDGGSSVGVTLLQHGVTPVDWGKVGITAVNASTGERLSFTGTPKLSDGQWTTWIELPAGSWNLTVTHTELQVGTEEALSLTVGAPSTATGASTAAVQGVSPALLLVVVAAAFMMVAASAGYVLLRRRADGVAPAAHGGLVEG